MAKEPAAAPKKMGWVKFEDRSAVLKRVIVPGDIRGLLLRTGSQEAGEAVREKALALGFKELKTRGTLRMLFPDGKVSFGARELAEKLGGTLIGITREELESATWTINLSDRVPALAPTEKPPAEIVPNMESITSIGTNARGEEVIFDGTLRFYRAVNPETGAARFVPEGAGERPTLFLRATRREDLVSIASSMVTYSLRATLHQAQFDRVIDAALAAGPHGQLEIERGEAAEIVRRSMIREITAIAIEGEASREKFSQALRAAESARFVLARPTAPGEPLSPSPALAALMRRVTRGSSTVDFRGGDDLRIAMPPVQAETAGSGLQVHDLAGVPEDGIPAYTANVLSRRAATGRSLFIVPEGVSEDVIERMRSDIGRIYGLEAVARIASAVSDGVQGGADSTIFFIGDRRPEALEALPQAALRDFPVVTSEDLVNLEREIARSRARLRDFNEGVEAQAETAEDSRAENIRQKPYQPLSRISEPFTMIPVALEGATTKSLERIHRDMEERGGVDAVVGGMLGQGLEDLATTLTAEQVDAVAMWENSSSRGRGFLLADQTGVGKGRSLAAMARAFLRGGEGRKVLYFTESAAINAPDVYRDLKDVGALAEAQVMFLTAGTKLVDKTIDPVTGVEMEVELSSPPPARRNAIFASEAWPDSTNMVITTYSQFRSKEDDPTSIWLRNALDENTLVIFDEAHNALNHRSMQGMNARAAIEAVGRKENVIFGTATPTRDPSGLNLYSCLLPEMDDAASKELLDNMSQGGEVAQEAFATMLAADGVMLRRDHDLSNIEFKVDLPDDETMLRYQEVMNLFSPAVELMIDVSLQIGNHLGRIQAREYHALRNRGLSEEAARARTNAANQYSINLGSPLANISRVAMNAIKTSSIIHGRAGQIVETVLGEIAEGRKPLITFHSTNAGLLQEVSRGPDGKVSEEAMEEAAGLTLRDQILRIHDGMYKVKVDGEIQDAREIYADIAESARLITEAIERLPADLSCSPVDTLIEQLESHGVSVGEISGRTLCYRDGRVQRRSPEERNRRATINKFNDGELDVMIYNGAGATGGSFHASSKFKDSRPRTMIELEAPVDVIKYVQALGRGNRYGQIHRPRVVSVMTGLTPEMRILQQRNRKLRSLGASVDGNRSHPLLLDDIPDLLNTVGDEAARNVLASMPALARRMGFTDIANAAINASNDNAAGVDTGSGADSMAVIDSLANKVLARSLMLSAADQDDLVQRIRIEFDALIEELESRNANPLRPKELDGEVEIRATALFSGVESEDNDIDTSAFLSPLYIHTAVHHFNEDAWTGDKLVTAIEEARRVYGAEGFEPWSERIMQNLPALMRPHLPEGRDLQDAMANPGGVNRAFKQRHDNYTTLAWLLENMKPGVMIRFPDERDTLGANPRIIVGLVPPAHPSHYDVPSAYKIKTVSPGMSKPETTSVSRILPRPIESIVFRPGLSETFSESWLKRFDDDAVLTRRLPVQILSGNILQAINEAARNRLGSVSLYRDTEGHVHRGIVVDKGKVDLTKIPVELTSGRVLAEMAHQFLFNDAGEMTNSAMLKVWGTHDRDRKVGEIEDADFVLALTANNLTVDAVPLRKSTAGFYRSRPGLFEAIFDKPMPTGGQIPDRAYRRGANNAHRVRIQTGSPENVERIMRILTAMEGAPMLTDGRNRPLMNAVINDLRRFGIVEDEPEAGEAAPEAEAPEAGQDDAAPADAGAAMNAGDGDRAEGPAPAAEPPQPIEEIDFDTMEWN